MGRASRGWVIIRLARILLSIHTTTTQETRPIVKINAAVFYATRLSESAYTPAMDL